MTTMQPGTRARDYLMCDAGHPLVSGAKLLDEFILYNLDETARKELCAQYKAFTGNPISAGASTDELSGGQKVLLMLLLALLSPARKICFIGLERALDAQNRSRVKALLERLGQDRSISMEDNR